MFSRRKEFHKSFVARDRGKGDNVLKESTGFGAGQRVQLGMMCPQEPGIACVVEGGGMMELQKGQ